MKNELTIGLFTYDATQWQEEPNAAFDAFLSGYRFQQRPLRASSFGIYRGMFGRLCEWAKGRGQHLFALREAELQEFLAQRKLSEETRHRYLLLFNTLFAHLQQLQGDRGAPDAPDNPALELLLHKQPPARDDPDHLSQGEVLRFIQALPAPDGWKRVRDRALALLVLGAGLRSREALELRVSDLQIRDGALYRLWVQANKPHPARQVPLHTWAQSEVMAWLQLRERLASGTEQLSPRSKSQILAGALVFPSSLTGAPLNPLTLFRLVKNTLDAAHLVKRYEGPTLLRNTCGALWLQSHEALQVSLWMGHAKTSTTEGLLRAPAKGKPKRSREPNPH